MTYQRNRGLTLLNNYQTSLTYYERALESAGSAEQKFNIYQESTKAHLDSLVASWENFWQDSIDSSLIKNAISALSGLIDIINILVNNSFSSFLIQTGLMSTAIITLGIGFDRLKYSIVGATIKTIAYDIANKGLIVTTRTLTTALLASPLFRTVVATAGIFAIVKGIDALTTSFKEQKEIVANLSTEINNLQTEYDQLKNKENRTKEEESYLKLLEKELGIKKELNKEATQKSMEKEFFDKKYFDKEEKLFNRSGIEKVNSYITAIKSLKEELNNAKTLDERKSIDKKILEFKEKLIESQKSILNYKNTLGKIPPELQTLAEAIDTILNSDGADKAEEQVNGITKSVEDLSTSLKDLQKSLSDSSSKIKEIKSILKSFEEDGYFNVDEIISLSEEYPQLLEMLGNEKAIREELNKILDEEQQSVEENYLKKLENSKNFYKNSILTNNNLIKTFAKNYDIDLKNFTKLSDLKKEVEKKMLSSMLSNWKKYFDATTGATTKYYKALQESYNLDFSGMGGMSKEQRAEYEKVNNVLYEIEKAKRDVDKIIADAFVMPELGKSKDSSSTSKENKADDQYWTSVNNKLEQYDNLINKIINDREKLAEGSEAFRNSLHLENEEHRKKVAYLEQEISKQKQLTGQQKINVTPTTSGSPSKGSAVINLATTQIGKTPYGYGDETLNVSVDCSGLVQAVYDKAVGIKVPRVAQDQYNSSQKISKNELKPGDLVFYSSTGSASNITHVGIYAGKNANGVDTNIEARKPGTKVQYTNTFRDAPNFKFVGAGRYFDPGTSTSASGTVTDLNEAQKRQLELEQELENTRKQIAENSAKWQMDFFTGYSKNLEAQDVLYQKLENKLQNYLNTSEQYRNAIQDEISILDQKMQIEQTAIDHAQRILNTPGINDYDKEAYTKILNEHSLNLENIKNERNTKSLEIYESQSQQFSKSLEPLNSQLEILEYNLTVIDSNDFDSKMEEISDAIEITKDLTSQYQSELARLQVQLSQTSNPILIDSLTSRMNELKSSILQNKKATYDYQKQLDQIKIDKITQQAEGAIAELNREIQFLDHSMEMLKDGAVSDLKLDDFIKLSSGNKSDIKDNYNYKIDSEREFQDELSNLKKTSLDEQNEYEKQAIISHLEQLKQLYLDYQNFISSIMTISNAVNVTPDQKLKDINTFINSQQSLLSQEENFQNSLIELQNLSAIKQIDITKDSTNKQIKITKDNLSTIVDETETHFDDQIDTYNSNLNSIVNLVGDKFTNIRSIINSTLSNIKSYKSGGGSSWSAIGDTNGDGKIDNTGNTDYVPSDPGGSSLNPPGFKPKKYAKGSNSAGGLSYVSEEGRELLIYKDGSVGITGDNGTELINLPKGTQVIPNKETENILKGNKSLSIPSYKDGTTNNLKLYQYRDGDYLYITSDYKLAKQYEDLPQEYKGYYDKTTRNFSDTGIQAYDKYGREIFANGEYNPFTRYPAEKENLKYYRGTIEESKKELDNQSDIVKLLERKVNLYNEIIEQSKDTQIELEDELNDYEEGTEHYEQIKNAIYEQLEIQQSAQRAIKRAIKDRYDYEFSLMDEQISNLQYQKDILESLNSDNLTEKLDINKNIVDTYKNQIKNLYSMRDAEEENGYEWNIINEKIKDSKQQLIEMTKSLADLELTNLSKPIDDINYNIDLLGNVDTDEEKKKLLQYYDSIGIELLRKRQSLKTKLDELQSTLLNTNLTEEERLSAQTLYNSYKEEFKQIQVDIVANDDNLKQAKDNIFNSIIRDLQKVRDIQEKQHNEQIEYLDKEQEKYNEIYDAKIKALDREEDQDNYDKELAEKQKEILNLQKEIDVLSLDDSIETRSTRNKKIKELEEKRTELEEFQADRQLELRKQSLSDEKELYDKEINQKRDNLNKSWNLEVEKWDLLFEAINDGTMSINQLLSMNGGWFGQMTQELSSFDSSVANYINNIKSMFESLSNINISIPTIPDVSPNPTPNPPSNRLTEEEEFINNKYREYLSRDADPEGMEYWKNRIDDVTFTRQDFEDHLKFLTDLINAKYSKQQIHASFLAGNEKKVVDVYKEYLDYTPNGENINYWVSRLENGLTYDQFIEEIKNSDAYKSKKYATGGLNTTTGFHWLDGTASKPEMVLNPEQTAAMLKLKDYLPDLLKNIKNNNMFSLPKINNPLNNLKFNQSALAGTGDVNYNLNLRIDNVTGDKKGGQQVFTEIVKGLKKMGK